MYQGDKTTVVDFSPKAITTNELYGSVNMALASDDITATGGCA